MPFGFQAAKAAPTGSRIKALRKETAKRHHKMILKEDKKIWSGLNCVYPVEKWFAVAENRVHVFRRAKVERQATANGRRSTGRSQGCSRCDYGV